MKTINKAEIDGNGNIVIQNTDNSTIIINKDNPEEIRKFFIDFQNQLSEIPKQIIDLMEAQNPNQVVTTGANIYLGLVFMSETLYGKPTGNIEGISFGVTITNLTKESRYFNAPFFKLSVPFETGLDTFAMINIVGQSINFPKKLEYREVASQNYLISASSKQIYDKAIANDPNATVQVIVSTTIGEVYKSTEYSVAKLLENFKYAR
jgi:hypothetical protein